MADYFKWIPLNRDDYFSLPEDGTWNLFTDGKKVSIERFKEDAMDHFYPEGRFFSYEDAIAWMPLPASIWQEAHDLTKKNDDELITKAQALKAIRHANINFSVESSIDLTKHKREVQEILDNVIEAQSKAINELCAWCEDNMRTK